MAENVGLRDGQARTALGVLTLFGTGILAGYTSAAWWAVGAMVASLIILASGTLRSCPLYSLFGLSTCK